MIRPGFIFVMVFFIFLNGCAAGTLVSTVETSHIDDTIELKQRQPEYAKIIMQVCGDFGYSTKHHKVNENEISGVLSTDGSLSSGLKKLFLGSSNTSTINYYSDDQGKTWHFEITARGNFGSSTMDALQQRWNAIKNELVAKTNKV